MIDWKKRGTKAMLGRYFTLLGIALVLSASGCGGDQTSDQNPTSPSASTAEGLWSGTINTNNTNRTLTAAVLDDGTHYFFYSSAVNPNQIAGVIQGTGTSNNGTFTSSNTKDFRIGGPAPVPVLDATISADYASRQFLNGSIAYSGAGTMTFTSSYNTAYDTAPTVASLAGVYTGQAGSSGGVQTATVTAATNGTFTGIEQSGCTFTGTVTARTRGNVFDQSISFGGNPCFFPNSTFQGIVYFDIATSRLLAATPNNARTDAAIFLGTKIP
jgi:hypothetical protein